MVGHLAHGDSLLLGAWGSWARQEAPAYNPLLDFKALGSFLPRPRLGCRESCAQPLLPCTSCPCPERWQGNPCCGLWSVRQGQACPGTTGRVRPCGGQERGGTGHRAQPSPLTRGAALGRGCDKDKAISFVSYFHAGGTSTGQERAGRRCLCSPAGLGRPLQGQRHEGGTQPAPPYSSAAGCPQAEPCCLHGGSSPVPRGEWGAAGRGSPAWAPPRAFSALPPQGSPPHPCLAGGECEASFLP